MTLPKPPRRTQQGRQLLVPCRNGCGNRVGGDDVECSVCQEMTRKWENNGDPQAHPREERPR